MASNGRKKLRKGPQVDPEYMARQKKSLRRVHRHVICFNEKELAAIEEYCRRFNVGNKSMLIREATMEHILNALDENHPTLF